MSNNTDSTLPLEQLRQIRIDKLNKLKKLGLSSFSSSSNKTHAAKEIHENFEKLENKEVTVAGRILSYREHGELVFADLANETGSIQLYIHKKELSPFNKDTQNFGAENLNLLDIGDFIEAKGVVTKTQRGVVSVAPKEIRLLTKSVRPLPSQHFGIKDEEERYRQRYVDLALNPETRDLFVKKSKFWNGIRQFMVEKGFLEVETPVLENTAGGADANPFITHHNALDIDVYLRISMGELWQKRLMVGGFEKTFELGRQFRNEGISREHLQDYTQMEFYWAYADYEDGMALVEEMYKKVLHSAFGTYEFEIGEHKVDINKKWERLDYTKAVLDATGVDITKATEDEMRAKLKELKVKVDPNSTKGRLMDYLWKTVRKNVTGPVFLIGHPVEVSPLAKRNKDNPSTVQRFQPIIAGSELGNGYSELNDPIDQQERFEEQQKARDAGDEEAQMHDKDFVRALEYGMPPVCGFGVSERVFSFFANKSIRECVLFPLLRPEDQDE
jgi:lysyl-tRNA synthetase class 2